MTCVLWGFVGVLWGLLRGGPEVLQRLSGGFREVPESFRVFMCIICSDFKGVQERSRDIARSFSVFKRPSRAVPRSLGGFKVVSGRCVGILEEVQEISGAFQGCSKSLRGIKIDSGQSKEIPGGFRGIKGVPAVMQGDIGFQGFEGCIHDIT